MDKSQILEDRVDTVYLDSPWDLVPKVFIDDQEVKTFQTF